LTPIKDAQEINDDLPEKFFLYIGNAYPHKNLEFLIAVFKDFLKTNPDFYLVLVGTYNYFYQQLEKFTDKHVVFAGFIPDKKLASYYRQAHAYIFPSLYEGFGLPPLEALAHQTPVLSSSTSCLPEILEDAVLYFDPKKQSRFIKQNADDYHR
jgi:glycosyltransferase involved in cell wall biosynthesis